MGDTSGSRGSIVASLILNADPYESTLMGAEDATRRASGSIGASLDRINKKQLNVAATSLLKNFVSPAALAVAGASMATDLIAGFSTGKFKNWEEAGRGLMESLKNGIESIPIVGTFAKLGEAIGNVVFGIDAANASLAETAKKISITDEMVKGFREKNNFIIADTQAINKRISDIGRSEMDKDMDKFKASQDAKNKINIDNIMKEWETKQKLPQEMIRTAGPAGSGAYTNSPQDVFIKNVNYENELAAIEKSRANFKEEQAYKIALQAREEFTNRRDLLKIEEQALIKQKAKTDAIELEAQMRNQAVRAANELLEVQRRQAQVQAEADAKFNQHMAEKIASETQDLKNAEQAQALRLQDSATGVSSSIGNIKVAGTMDFTKSKEVEVAQKQLDSTVRSENELKSLNETLRKMGGTV